MQHSKPNENKVKDGELIQNFDLHPEVAGPEISAIADLRLRYADMVTYLLINGPRINSTRTMTSSSTVRNTDRGDIYITDKKTPT